MRLFKRDPIEAIDDSVCSAGRVRLFVEGLACPSCNKKKLKLAAFMESGKVWEAQFACTRCKVTGVVNESGITVNLSGVQSVEVAVK